MNRSLTDYLGKPASDFLQDTPFRNWSFERSVDEDLPDVRIDYSCEEQGISISCDEEERIGTIFLTSENLLRTLLGMSLSLSRKDVLDLLGAPSRSGAAHQHPILGQFGPWDRFDKSQHSIHVEYRFEIDKIKMVTLMRSDVAP